MQLADVTLPAGANAKPYSFDLKPYLTVTGDAAYASAAGVTWSLVGGTLPSGLLLNSSTGVLAGTPVGQGAPASVTVQATYKGKVGQKAYSLAVANTEVVLAPEAWGQVVHRKRTTTTIRRWPPRARSTALASRATLRRR